MQIIKNFLLRLLGGIKVVVIEVDPRKGVSSFSRVISIDPFTKTTYLYKAPKFTIEIDFNNQIRVIR